MVFAEFAHKAKATLTLAAAVAILVQLGCQT